MMNDNSEVTFEIVEEIGVISTHDTGWCKELNLVSWNGGTAKYDIRDWAPDHSRMGRGITLQEQEMRTILSLLKRRRRSAARTSAMAGPAFAPAPGPAAEEEEDFDAPVSAETGEIGPAEAMAPAV